MSLDVRKGVRYNESTNKTKTMTYPRYPHPNKQATITDDSLQYGGSRRLDVLAWFLIVLLMAGFLSLMAFLDHVEGKKGNIDSRGVKLAPGAVQQASVKATGLPDPCTLEVVDCAEAAENISESQKADAMLDNTPMEGMGSLIVKIAKEYGVSWRIIIGVAAAESSLGQAYWFSYDKNCHNAWGIKPPKGQRSDGSYLRCYNDWESGVRSIAALLSRQYKNMKPEQMVTKYTASYKQHWVNTVNQYYLNY